MRTGSMIGHAYTGRCRCAGPSDQPIGLLANVFTARCYASAVLAMGLCPSVCVCLSVTSRCSTKMAKRSITQMTPHDSAGTLVFYAKDLREIRPGSPPTRAPNAGGVVKIGDFLQIGKGKVFPYSLPSVGPGADSGVQAVSPQVT